MSTRQTKAGWPEWGTGYRRVTQACAEGGCPPPAWQELGAALRVVFQPHPEAAIGDSGQSEVPANVPVDVPVNESFNERQRWLLDQLSQGRRLKSGDVAVQFGVTTKTAKRDIADLKARGLIEFVGAPKTGFYRLIKRDENL